MRKKIDDINRLLDFDDWNVYHKKNPIDKTKIRSSQMRLPKMGNRKGDRESEKNGEDVEVKGRVCARCLENG